MDVQVIIFIGWVASGLVSAVLIRRRGYQGGLAIGLMLFAAICGPSALAFFVPYGGLRERAHGARRMQVESAESSNGTASMPR
jgi:hypothetical protein